MSTIIKLHFSGSDPSDAEREDLNILHAEWTETDDPNDLSPLSLATGNLIDALMSYAGISTVEVEQCDECGGEATVSYLSIKEPAHFCDSCEHDAIRSGWEPGK